MHRRQLGSAVNPDAPRRFSKYMCSDSVFPGLQLNAVESRESHSWPAKDINTVLRRHQRIEAMHVTIQFYTGVTINNQ